MRANSLVNAMVSASPPSLKSVGESLSGPAALLRFSNCSSLVISATVGEAYVYIPLWVRIITTEWGGGFRPAELFLEVFRPPDGDDDTESGLKFRLSHRSLHLLWVFGALYF